MAVIRSYDFAGASGALGAGDNFQQVGDGTLNRNGSGGGTGSAAGLAGAVADTANTYPNDQYSDQTVVAFNGQYSLPAVRVATSGRTYYNAYTNGSSEGVEKYVAGSYTDLGGSGATFANGNVHGIQAVGTTLRVRKDGAVVGSSYTDSSIASGRAGPGVYDTGQTIDDWVGGDFTAGFSREQEGFRWRADDGSESAASWLAAQDAHLARAVSLNTRLRMLVNATGDPTTAPYRLDCKKSTDGIYAAVPLAAAAPGTVDAAIILGTDDAQQIGTTMTLTGVTIGGSLDATTDWAGLRFQGIAIPPGATITAAYISVVPSASTEDEPLVTIYLEDADSPGTFTTGASNISNRARTSGVAWSSTNLGATGTSYHNSPSLAAIVQAVVDRVGWASGNAMVVIIQGGATSTRDLTIKSFENTGATPPLLHIEYTIPAPIHLSASANIAASGEATTAQLTPPSGKTTGDFVAGRIQDDENPADTIDITANDYTELEWCLTAQSGVAQNGDIYQFRVTIGGVALDTYTVTPEWTIGAGDQSASPSAAVATATALTPSTTVDQSVTTAVAVASATAVAVATIIDQFASAPTATATATAATASTQLGGAPQSVTPSASVANAVAVTPATALEQAAALPAASASATANTPTTQLGGAPQSATPSAAIATATALTVSTILDQFVTATAASATANALAPVIVIEGSVLLTTAVASAVAMVPTIEIEVVVAPDAAVANATAVEPTVVGDGGEQFAQADVAIASAVAGVSSGQLIAIPAYANTLRVLIVGAETGISEAVVESVLRNRLLGMHGLKVRIIFEDRPGVGAAIEVVGDSVGFTDLRQRELLRQFYAGRHTPGDLRIPFYNLLMSKHAIHLVLILHPAPMEVKEFRDLHRVARAQDRLVELYDENGVLIEA